MTQGEKNDNKLQRHFLYITPLFGILIVACLASICASICLGAVAIPLRDVINVLLLRLEFSQATIAPETQLIIESIRLPRALLAASTGALLALCGAVTQGLFRNPLADPSLIGVTAGASLGGSLTIFFGAGLSQWIWPELSVNLSLISLGAFVGGTIAVWLVFRMATNELGTSVPVMLLTGIAITALASSFTQLLEFFSDDMTLRRISLWRMGGLEGANAARVMLSFVMLVTAALFFQKRAHALNALLLGESEARHLGVNVDNLKRLIILLIAGGVGISVALSGTIAFIGLVVPHFMRMFVGPNHSVLIPASILAGAILLSLADTFSRMVIAPSELPVGLITALIGAPVFLSLLRHRREYGF